MYRVREAIFEVRSFGQAFESPPPGSAIWISGHNRLRNPIQERQALPEYSQQRGCEIVHSKGKYCPVKDSLTKNNSETEILSPILPA